eukprot:9545967-Ditylum_brightwellii.AAC.1
MNVTGKAAKLKQCNLNDRLTLSGSSSQPKSIGTSRKGVGGLLIQQPTKRAKKGVLFEDAVGADG